MMLKNKKSVIRILIVTVLVTLLVVLAIQIRPKSTTNSAVEPKNNVTKTTVVKKPVYTTTVMLTPNGFEPKDLTVKVNTTITWMNKSGKNASVNSANYPTHQLYPILNLGLFADGENLEASFKRAGSYHYVNHLNPAQTGSIIVSK